MQIHELNNFSGALGSGSFIAVDDGTDTGKLSTQQLLEETNREIEDAEATLNARIDNIIAGGAAPSEAEIIDARLGAIGESYSSLGTAIRSQVDYLEDNILISKGESDKGFFSVGNVSGWWLVTSGALQPATDTYIGTKKFLVRPGDKLYAKFLGEKYYIFWSQDGTYISGARKDYGYVVVPNGAYICALTYRTAQGSPIDIRINNTAYDGSAKARNEIALVGGGSVSAYTVYWWWLVTDGAVNSVSSIIGTEKFIVEGCQAVQANNISGEKYYVFWDENDNYVGYTRKDSGAAAIPSGAYYCAFDYLVSQQVDEVEFTLTKSASSSADDKPVICVRNGNDIQIKSKLFGSSKYIGLNATLNGSQNGGFNLLKYIISDTNPDAGSLITGTDYKDASDDIAPLHYGGSYIGGNHGKEPVFKLECSSHGKTVEDIGSVWTSANGYDYVIYKIDDTNHISVMGDYNGSYTTIVIDTPTTPLTHSSGATHTGSIAFTSADSQQLRPATNKKSVSIRNSDNEYLTQTGYIGGEYIEIIESYRIINIVDLITYLKNNVGSCTNESYYAEAISDSVLVQNVYRFSEGCGESVCVNITPLGEVLMDFFGGVQSAAIGDDYYVPYTVYDSIQTQDANTVRLDSSKWRDADFPPYKYYQFNGNNGFALGYCIDTAQAEPTNRKDLCSEDAGFYYGSSHKMYPKFYAKRAHPNVYGKSFCFYAFRAPVLKADNKVALWYETANAVYLEIEFFATYAGVVEFPAKALGKNVTVVKKTSSVNIPDDIINTGGMLITTSGTGSITLKFS